MSEPILFTQRSRLYAMSIGPVSAIREAVNKRRLIGIVFWVLLLGGALVVIGTQEIIPAILTLVFITPVAMWGQYWRDVDATARSFLQVAFAEIGQEMRDQGIDPADESQRAQFDPSRLSDRSAEYWQWVQEYLHAEDVQMFVAGTPAG